MTEPHHHRGTSNASSQRHEVPVFKRLEFGPEQQRYAVVIPVINEGERIRALLQRMNQIGVPALADIVVVDGGSTDGSLEEQFLAAQQVSTLLTKTGPGKLSAQLRCAYAYCLERHYLGIVTIDGNNKDDPAPIADFVHALEGGIDFVQASRFISGGVAANTPLSRYVAIRLIHAPLLSLFSGFPWTDTTQGFRAYSRRLLDDPRIALFRSVFMDYELLAYLSLRAPRLGFHCLELPTARRYPEGDVPTKITSFRGNLDVFCTLIRTVLGKYNPRSSE